MKIRLTAVCALGGLFLTSCAAPTAWSGMNFKGVEKVGFQHSVMGERKIQGTFKDDVLTLKLFPADGSAPCSGEFKFDSSSRGKFVLDAVSEYVGAFTEPQSTVCAGFFKEPQLPPTRVYIQENSMSWHRHGIPDSIMIRPDKISTNYLTIYLGDDS